MISKINFSRAAALVALYEGEGGDAGAGGTPPEGGDQKPVTSQAELNAVLKREKDKFRADREKLIADKQKLAQQMEELQSKIGKGMSDEERTAFETQIEELRTAHLTAEEQARRAKEKSDKEWETKYKSLEAETGSWRSRHDNLLVGYSIATASREHEVLPTMTKFVEALLRPMTRLVENVDAETGKPNGTFTPKVKLPSTDKEGKPIDLDLTVDAAIKTMKETPEQYGHIFKGQNAGGLGGGNNGTPGKAPNMKELAKDPARYMEMRKKNPASVGL